MRRVLALGAIASLLLASGATGAEALPGKNNASVTGSAEVLSSPRSIIATWRVIDPDPFSDVSDLAILWGDGSAEGPQSGTPLICGTVLTAAGLDHSFKKPHRYLAAGTYLISITIKTRQNVCGTTFEEPDTASYQFEMTVE